MHFNIGNVSRSPYWDFSRDVRQMCSPLFDQFGLNYFDFARFYPDNTNVTLSTDPYFIQFLVGNNGYKCAAGRVLDGKHLWSSFNNPRFLEEINIPFGYYYGLTYARYCKDYLQLVNFAAHKNNPAILDIFLNYGEAFDYFIAYFLKTIDKFLARYKDSRILLPDNFIEKTIDPNEKEQKLLAFIGKINYQNRSRENNYLFKIGAKTINLTKRELQCLFHLTKGYCSKKTARELSVSSRTVEAFCEKIFEKTGVNNRLLLISLIDASMRDILPVLANKE